VRNSVDPPVLASAWVRRCARHVRADLHGEKVKGVTFWVNGDFSCLLVQSGLYMYTGWTRGLDPSKTNYFVGALRAVVPQTAHVFGGRRDFQLRR
jgi:hypothetical protein